MNGQVNRLAKGGRIDRAKLLQFTFDGRRYHGHPGDTLASALLANGVTLVGRSYKYHRPRGILSAGAEEPNALIQLGLDERTEPNLRATQIELYDGLVAASQNRWPSLKFDVMAINSIFHRLFPAGFYYKTFMWPKSFWMPCSMSSATLPASASRRRNRPDPTSALAIARIGRQC
jgi:sarcosine oxidase subunit alpha